MIALVEVEALMDDLLWMVQRKTPPTLECYAVKEPRLWAIGAKQRLLGVQAQVGVDPLELEPERLEAETIRIARGLKLMIAKAAGTRVAE